MSRPRLLKTAALAASALWLAAGAAPAAPRVSSGAAWLVFSDGGVKIFLGDDPAFAQERPVALEIVTRDAAASPAPGIWHEQPYDEARETESGGLAATARCLSPGGAEFFVRDEWSAGGAQGRFRLRRTVEVLAASQAEAGFASRFSLLHAATPPPAAREGFMPGMWYRRNEFNDPARGLTSGDGRAQAMIRADRMPLPVFALRDAASGLTLTLLHSNPDTTALREDIGRARVIHPGLRFGALGLCSTEPPQMAFAFPGTEGDRTQVSGPGGGWALRNHPIQPGFAQEWEIVVAVSRTADYPAAARDAWRLAWDDFRPPVEEVDQRRVYEAGIDIFLKYWKSFGGMAGVPFQITVTDGVDKEGRPVKSGQAGDYAFQMGFVGQQTCVGAQLIRYGLEDDVADAARRADALRKGEAIIDGWVRESMTPGGLPRQWYGTKISQFRDFDPFLRLGCEGVGGVLQAWEIMRRNNRDRPEWKEYVRRFADWLVAHQNADGSWFRRYRHDGTVSPSAEKGASDSRNNTPCALPFLCDAWLVFGDESYRQALLRAGEFCLTEIDQKYQYRGGATDTANLQDKEGGIKAFEGFLALHDATGDPRFLAAARQAADYAETCTFAWRLPLPEGGLPGATIPLHQRSGMGLSILTTVPGAVDNGIGYLAFAYYRLHLLTGDPHYRDFARFIHHGSKATSDWDGALGYAHPALQTEAGRMGGDMGVRGRSVNAWLPWVSICNLNPMMEFRDAFGTFDLEAIERLPPDERQARERAWARTRGYATAPASAWQADNKGKVQSDPINTGGRQ